MEKTSAYPGTSGSPAIPSSVTTSGNSALGGAAASNVDSAGAALHSGIDKAADPARQAVDRLSSAAHRTVDRLADGASQVADRFSEQTKRVTEAPKEALEFSRSWVQEKPLEAVAVAMAIGFVLGRLTSR